MSRLESAAKAHYYPIPPSVTAQIVGQMAAPDGGRVLDPCCGEGVALGQIAAGLKLEPYGVELQEARAETARLHIEQVRNAFVPTMRDGQVTRIFNAPLQMTTAGKWGWNLLYLNPPFDHDPEAGRVELAFLKQMRPALCPGGLLVYVVPEHLLTHRQTAEYIASWFDEITVYAFPEEHRQFKQIVLFGVHRSRAQSPDKERVKGLRAYGDGTAGMAPLPHPIEVTPPSPPRYILPKVGIPSKNLRFLPIQLPTMAIMAEAEAERYGALTTEAWSVQMARDPAELQFRPLTPLRIGHLVNILAAGYLNNCVLEQDGETVFIKGQTHKVHHRVTEIEPRPDGDGLQEVVTTTDRYETDITLLRPDGTVESVAGNALELFLKKWMSPLMAHITRDFDPVYQFNLNGYGKIIETLNQGRIIPNTTQRGLLPAQKHAVAALATYLDDKHEGQSDALLCGEMGTGKTLCGPAVARCIGAKRILVMCPPHLTGKWEREIRHVIPNVRACQLRTISDVDDFFGMTATAEQPVFGIMKETTARSGSGWVHAYQWVGGVTQKQVKKKKPPELTMGSALAQAVVNRAIDMEAEPTVEITIGKQTKTVKTEALLRYLVQFRRLTDPETGELLLVEGRPMLPDNFRTKRLWGRPDKQGRRTPLHQFVRRNRGNERPVTMKEALQRQTIIQQNVRCGHDPYGRDMRGETLPLPQSVGKAKWPLATYINHKYRKQIDLLVVDEIHEMKGHTSDRGYAFGRLVSASKKTLGLSGTIYGGKAGTLFSLLYRLSPAMKQRYQHGALSRWVRQYGVFQEVAKTRMDNDGRQTGNSRTYRQVKELPGASPALVRWLLDKSVFLGLHDMGFALPGYTETPHLMVMSPQMEMMYGELKRQLVEEMKAALVVGDKTLLAGYLQALLSWPDSPWRPKKVVHPRTGKTVAFIPGLSHLQPGNAPKEEAMVRSIEAELAQNRRVLLLCQQTDTLDITPQWVEMLKARNIKAAVLKCEPSKREAWIENVMADGVEVIISHPRRVQTGLDLLGFPAIKWIGQEYSVYTVKQANRRSWRIGQTEDVTVEFYAYAGTLQEEALRLVAAKMAAVERIDGNTIAEDSLAELDVLAQTDIVTTLTKIVLGEAEQVATPSLEEAFASANTEIAHSRETIGAYGGMTERVTPLPEPVVSPVVKREQLHQTGLPKPDEATTLFELLRLHGAGV